MKGPTKPGYYWVLFTGHREWVVDRINTNLTHGSLYWNQFGGRVEDRDVVAWQGPLEAPKLPGDIKPELKGAVSEPMNPTGTGEYVAPAKYSERSYLGRQEKKSDSSAGIPSESGSATSVDRPVRVPDSSNPPVVPESSVAPQPSIPVGSHWLFNGSVHTVTGTIKRGRGWAVEVTNAKHPKLKLTYTITEWKHAKQVP